MQAQIGLDYLLLGISSDHGLHWMESQSSVILNSDYPFLGRAMGTAIERVSGFDPMSNNSTVAVLASGSEGMDCTFEAIKNV
jgi:hypothetical protein